MFLGLGLSLGRRRGGDTVPPADYIITNDAEWASTMALGAATLAGKVAEVRGALGAVSIVGLAPASTFTIRGGAGGSVRRVFLQGTVNRITFDGLPHQMTGWPSAHGEMVFFDNGVFDNLRWQGCSFRHGYGAGLADFDMTATYDEYVRVDNVQTATTTATRYALTWDDPARTSGWIEFFNRGSNAVHVAIGGAGVTATVGSPSCAAGQRLRISDLNPTTDTHMSILTASGTSEINARTEIGLGKYLSNVFAASGSADVRRIDMIGNSFRDVASAIKGVGRPSLAVIMDNDIDRIYGDIIAVPPRTGGAAYIFRNLTSVPFARSGIAENLFGDAGDPHGDLFQSFGDGSGTIGPIYVGGNRPRRSARRAGVNHQGVFFSDNDISPSYNGVYVVSEMLIGGSTNGISSGEAAYPTGDLFVYGATVMDPADLAGGASSVRLTTVAENRTSVQSVVAQNFIKEAAGDGFVRDNTFQINTAASIPALFPNIGDLAAATNRAQIEAALTTAAEALGIGGAATANAIDWTTTDHTAVILWENVASGVAWEDLTGQAINSVITLPLRKVLNRRAGQTIVPGAGVEWRSVASDGTTEVQAWTTSSGTVQPDQFVQIRAQSAVAGLTPTNFDVTINGFLSRTVITTAATTPAVFHTQSGTGPYFLDPVTIPASTTAAEFETNIFMPAAPAGTVNLVATGGARMTLELTTAPALRVSLLDSAGNIMFSGITVYSGAPQLLNQWIKIRYLADLAGGIARVFINDSEVWSTSFTAPSPSFATATNRRFAMCGSYSGTLLLPSGYQVEYADLYFTTSGVRSLRKRVSGNAATVNADAWKLGGDAT